MRASICGTLPNVASAFEETKQFFQPASGEAAPSSYTTAFNQQAQEQAEGSAFAATSQYFTPGEGEQVDMSGTYRQWYTGANQEGGANGWDSDFMRTAQNQADAAYEAGNTLQRFEQEDAVGVVTWNGAKDSKGNELAFGDIVTNGERVGNVYEDVDKHTANILMGEWTIQDGARKARLNEGDTEKIQENWENELRAIEDENTAQAERAVRGMEFAEDVEERADEENVAGITALGAGGGAAVGFGAGALATAWLGPGAIIGGVIGAGIGAVAGGFGAYMNQDSLSYQIAREREKLDWIKESESTAAYGAEAVKSLAMVVNSVALSPLPNLLQGSYDIIADDEQGFVSGFDPSSGGEFQRTNEEGERVASGYWQVADVVARVANDALMFASPAGRMAYQAQMSASISGSIAGLGTGKWDDRNLRLDSVWTHEDGSFAPGNAVAGIANVGVEAVQLGGISGLFSRLQRTGRSTQEGNFLERINLRKPQRQALKEGGSIEQVAGRKFVFDAEGKIVGDARATLSMLAPSEALQSLSAKAIARREAARAKGALDSERLYHASYDLTVGSKAAQTALVNAFGEAQEEGLQSILEPLQHGHSIDPEEVFRSAAMGFASGLGMGIAARATGVSTDQRMYETANLSMQMRRGEELSRDDWDKMSQIQKRTMVRSFQLNRSIMQTAYKSLQRNRVAAMQGDVVAADRVRSWFKKWSTTQLNKGTKATDASHTIVMLDDRSFRTDAIVTSHTQFVADQENRSAGIREQLKNFGGIRWDTDTKAWVELEGEQRGELQRLREQLAEKQGDPALTERVAKAEAAVEQMKVMLGHSDRIHDDAQRLAAALDNDFGALKAAIAQGDRAAEQAARDQAKQKIDRFNDRIRSFYDMQPRAKGFTVSLSTEERLALAKAVSRISTRHPEDSSASFQSFIPQIDVFFSENGANGIAGVSQLTNKAMRSDFDGDKVHNLQQLMLDDKEYLDLRSGTNILGASMKPEIGTTEWENWIVNEARVARKHPDQAIRDFADNIVSETRAKLEQWYRDPADEMLEQDVIDRVMAKVEQALTSGGDVRDVLLTEMVKEAGPTLMAIGRGAKTPPAFKDKPLSNQYNELAQMMTENLYRFQDRYAARRPRKSRRKSNPGGVAPASPSTDVGVVEAIRAGNEAANIINATPGDNLFRMFQKLHYQLMNSKEKYVGWSRDAKQVGFDRLAEFYEQLSRDAVGMEYADIAANNAIVASVMTKLKRLSLDPDALAAFSPGVSGLNNMALLANIETARWVWDMHPDTGQLEKRYTGETVTLAQQLLYQSAEEYRAEHAQVWETADDVQPVYHRMISLSKPPKQGDERKANAERAFVEVFDAVPLYDLIGEESAALGGITVTLGQFFRSKIDMDPDMRSAEHEAAKLEPAYRDQINGEKNTATPPYSIGAVSEARITTYRGLVDSVFSAASAEISMTRSGKTKGKVTGRMARTDEAISEEIQQTYNDVRALMRKMRAPFKTAEDIKNFVEANPDVGILMLNGIPDDIMPLVYKGQKNGKPRLATWYYGLFADTLPNGKPNSAKKMEWDLRWNIWQESWQLAGQNVELDENVDSDRKIMHIDKLDSRMHRLMYMLSTLETADSHFYEEFITKGEMARDKDEFMKWLNTESGFVGNGAPMLAWVDDTSSFDSTKTGSGWSEQVSTTQLRDDMRKLRDGIAHKMGEVDFDQNTRDSNAEMTRLLRQGLRAEKGLLEPGEVASQEAVDRWNQWKAVIKNAQNTDLSYGPRAMVIQTAIMAFGIYGQAHTKGTNPEFLAAVEAAEAVLGAFGYTVNLERLIGDLTTHNEDAVAAAPDLIVKDGGRLMDADGNSVDWGTQTAETMLDILEEKPDNAQLVVSMLAPQVMELGFDNKPRRQAMGARSVEGLLNSTSNKDQYNDNGKPGLKQAMEYLSGLEGRLRKKNPFAIQQRVTEMVIDRTSGLDHSASLEEIQEMTVQAYMDLAAALQDIGRTQVAPGEKDPLHQVWQDLRKSLRTAAAKRLFDFDLKEQEIIKEYGEENIVLLLQDQVKEFYEPQLDRLEQMHSATADPQRQAEIERLIENLEYQRKKDYDRVKMLLEHDVVAQTVTTYDYDESMTQAEKDQRQRQLIEYVARNGDVLAGAGPAMIPMQTINRYLYEDATTQAASPPDLTDAEWTTLAKHVISLHLANLVSVGSPTNSPPAYPDAPKDGKVDKRRYWDFTRSYLADFLDPNDTSGIVQAAREHAIVSGKVTSEKTARETDEIKERLMSTIFRGELYGPWTPAIPIQQIEAHDLITGASATPTISMAGLLTQRHSAVAAATRRRTKDVPPPDFDSKTALSWNDLNWEQERDPKKKRNPFSRTVKVMHPGGREADVPLVQLDKRFARRITVTFVDPVKGKITHDLTTNDNIAPPWGPSMDAGSGVSQELKTVSLLRLRNEAERLVRQTVGADRAAIEAALGSLALDIDFLHPDNQPSTEEYANSLWFEGTVFESEGDVADSLLYSLWFGSGGVNAQVQQNALDTRKKGLAGIEHYNHPSRSKIEVLEQRAKTSFSDMLHGKTTIVMNTDLGNGVLEPSFYNAVLKLMKMKHWVDGTDQNGNKVRLSAEQVMERQAKYGPGYWNEDGTEMKDAQLWVPSDQVLAEMMGEQFYGGLPGRFYREEMESSLSDIPTYAGRWTEEMGFKPSGVAKKKLTDTRVAKAMRLSDPTSSLELDTKQRNAYKRRQESFRFHRRRVLDERNEQRPYGWDPRSTIRQMQETASQWLEARDVTLQLPDALQFAKLPSIQSVGATRAAINTLIAEQQGKTGDSVAGFIFQAGGGQSAMQGLLSQISDAEGRIRLAPGDIVAIDFNSFMAMYDADKAREEARAVIRFLASQNVVILPLAENGVSGLATEMAAELRANHRYERYNENPRILVPDVMVGRRYMNAAASRSALTTASGVTVRKQRIMGLLKDRSIEENTMVRSMRRRRSGFDSVQFSRNIVPVNVAAKFGVPSDPHSLQVLRNHLEGLNTPEARAQLAKQAATKPGKEPKQKDIEAFNEAFDRLMGRIDKSIEQKTTLPLNGMEFGTGDIIPLLSQEGELLLYRHGHKFPYENFHDQLEQNEPGKSGRRKVAVYSHELEQGATTHRGRVNRVTNRQKFGIEIELEIDSKSLGSKQIVEINGMKWLIAPLGSQFPDVEAPVLGSGEFARHMDGYGSLHDALSKQATQNLVVNFRNAFTFFETDIISYVQRAWGTSRNDTLRILHAIEKSGNKMSEKEVKNLQDMVSGSHPMLQMVQQVMPTLNSLPDITTVDWENVLTDESADAYVARALVLYLLSEGSQLRAAMYSSGLFVDTSTEPDAQSQRMPELFTRMLDLAPVGSEVRRVFFEEFNRQLGENGREEWFLDETWNLIRTDENGNEIEMILDFGEAHVSDDNPELNVQAQNRKTKQGSSVHAGLVTQFGVGGEILPRRTTLNKIDRALADKRTIIDTAEMWQDLTHARLTKATQGPGSQWQRGRPAEQEYSGWSLQRFKQYRKDIDWENLDSLNDDERVKIENKINDLIAALSWDSPQRHIIDFWIRQALWRPAAGPSQVGHQDVFYYDEVIGALDKMLENVDDGILPTQGHVGPSWMAEIDLRLLFNNAGRGGWKPYRVPGEPDTELDDKDYGAWISLAFGSGLDVNNEIDELMRLDLDGFMNTYRSMLHQQGRFLTVTIDKELEGVLLDENTNELIAFSTSPIQRDRMMEEIILPRKHLRYDGLRGITTAESLEGYDGDRSVEALSRKRIAGFRRKNKIRPRERAAGIDYVKYGSKVIDSNADMHSLSRILLALRHGTTMLNPGLYLSAIPEQGFRMYLNGMTNILTGESSGRFLGGVQARLGEMTNSDRMGRLGFTVSEYDTDTIGRLNRLYSNMAADNTFAGSLIKELVWQKPKDDNTGAIVRFFEKFAQVGNKWQDPTWGMPQRSMAQHYVEAVIRAVASRPISNVMSVRQIIASLEQDFGYFAKHHPQIHQMASNAVVDYRGLKNTPISLALKAIYEPLTRSSSTIANFAGTLIKLPLMYGNFTANMLTTLTGMQGYSQIYATFMDGRQTAGTLMHRMALAMKGEKISEADKLRYDMSSTMDGYTIANAFIKGGVTQTGLFFISMLTGGLTGEDEEAKRRRRLAQAQDVPLLADPRRLEADFRNKDVIFLDWLPEPLQAVLPFTRVAPGAEEGDDPRSVVQMSWLMKPFLSPIIGMQRFMQTGDFGWVTHGFIDGVGSLPVFNKDMYDDAIRSADELAALAAEQQELGTPDSTRNTLWLLTQAVGVYEKMLLENMFVNSIYTGFDEWDRDATKLPLRDSDGDLQKTMDNEPRANDYTLETFLDEDGNLAEGYQNRDEWSKLMAYYTKNNFTAAAVLSLFTGNDDALFRGQMPVKMREIETPQITQDEATLFAAELMRNYYKEVGEEPRRFTLQEITKTLSQNYAENKQWNKFNNVDAEAAKLYQDPEFNPPWNPLSTLNEKGDEVLTTEGAARVLDSIRKGSVSIDDPALQGISIPNEMRMQIQKQFLEDVTQEGVDLGLTNSQAVNRAKRLFFGPIEDPTVQGFESILWNDRIPTENKRLYKQLNTTYVTGPDGYPWATGFSRGGILNQMGVPKRFKFGPQGSTTTDSRMNTVDITAGINTGLRGLVPFHKTENVPTDREIGQSIVDAIEDLELGKGGFEPFSNKKSNGRFYRGGGGYYRRSYGGGYGSGSPTIYFSKMPYLSNGTNVYGNSVKNIFWDSALIRRATIRRERVQSARGRLKQWQ